MTAVSNINLTAASIAEQLRDMGYRGKIKQTESGYFVESSTDGLQVFVYCLGADGKDVSAETDSCDTIRLYGGWDDLPHYNERNVADFINWFNSDKRFGKIYTYTRNGRFCLRVEAEWIVSDGIAPASFERFVRIFFGLYTLVSNALDKIRSVDDEAIRRRHNQAVQCANGRQDNNALAAELYRENSDAGYAGSQNNLGDLYKRGVGVGENLAYAVYWYTRAAERGEPTAYLSLAQVFAASAQEMDLWVDAGKFAMLAAKHLPDGRNKATAEELIGHIANQLSAEDWARATELTRTYYPLYQELQLMSDAPEPGIQIEASSAASH
jgi:hypothetical protein